MTSDKRNQTHYSFGEKWRATSDFQSGGISGFDSDTLGWILARNGFSSVEDLGRYLSGFRTVLDAGCGNGRILGLMSDVVDQGTELFGFDFSSADVARENLVGKVRQIFDADLMDPSSLSPIPRPDFIYCQEVLHHTADPEHSFGNLVDILLPDGEIAIYVYKRKAPVREFTDDHVREQMELLDTSTAMALAAEFTALGRTLADLNLEVDIPAVQLLGIPAGRYSIQRFLYHFFSKCYWNPELSEEHNNMVNYDWYHPSLCSRHTLEEVLGWFESRKLTVIHSHVDDYGITVRGTKS